MENAKVIFNYVLEGILSYAVYLIGFAFLLIPPVVWFLFGGYWASQKPKKARKALTVLAFFAGLFWVFYSIYYPSGSWNYKMTVAIETPEGVKTGSAVREVEARTGPKIFDISTDTDSIKGEAVVIDLGARGLVFALMRGDAMGVDYGKAVFYSAFGRPPGLHYRLGTKGIRYFNTLDEGTSVNLTQDSKKLPMLVRFKDINDPKTVERVDPADMAATLGAGVSLKSVTIEITDDSVTEGIEEKLGWLGEYYDKMFDGQRFEIATAANKFANSANSGDFSTRGKK